MPFMSRSKSLTAFQVLSHPVIFRISPMTPGMTAVGAAQLTLAPARNVYRPSKGLTSSVTCLTVRSAPVCVSAQSHSLRASSRTMRAWTCAHMGVPAKSLGSRISSTFESSSSGMGASDK
ncbi:MAG: hypothetical protein DDT35_01520 [Firmicutes bacterium]|nr:hypothetical protein [Bacillota bacterium]